MEFRFERIYEHIIIPIILSQIKTVVLQATLMPPIYVRRQTLARKLFIALLS